MASQPKKKVAGKSAKAPVKAAKKSSTKPVKPSAKSAAATAKKPVAKKPAKPVKKPAAKPAKKPADKLVAKPNKPAKVAAKVAKKPAAKVAAKATKKPAAKVVAKAAKKPAAKVVAKAAKKPTAKVVAKAKRPVAKLVAKATKKPAGKPTKKPAAKAAANATKNLPVKAAATKKPAARVATAIATKKPVATTQAAKSATATTPDAKPPLGKTVAEHVAKPATERPSELAQHAPALERTVDPMWGELPPPAPAPPRSEFASFWESPDTATPAADRPLPSSRFDRTPPGRPPEPDRDRSGSRTEPSSHLPLVATPRPDSLEGGASLESGDGRRRRRRRRRGGRGGVEGSPGLEGAPREAQPQLPQDPIHRRLRRQFNLRDFRPGQEQAIRDLLGGRDVLAIMPTGAGKSLTYQLTAFELPGVTVVVSPLLALMSDQLIKLRKTGAVAARLDSTETVKEKRATLERIEEGRHKIIYVTPERAASGALLTELGGQKVSLFVVDEAHCVSEWGHDFRPAYLGLKQCIVQLAEYNGGKRPVVLALTATATPQVADDIIQQLSLADADRVHTGFSRPSLTFEVRVVDDLKQQVKRLLRLIRRVKGPVIVYCSTVRDVEGLAGALPKLGIKCGMYHGKLTKYERDDSQRAFMRNQPRIMIATNAFGLGVDKPDIRMVVHFNMPGSIEAYYQEAGRAGRDGKPARCIMLYNSNDESVQEFFVGGKYPTRGDFRQVSYGLSTGEGTLKDIALRAETSQQKARVVLGVLKDHGFTEELPGPIFRMTSQPDELTLGRAAEDYRKRREGDRGKLEAMIRYARSSRCRVQLLLEYFGELNVPLCKHCDNCVRYGEEAARERVTDLTSPIEPDALEPDDGESIPELPEPPPPPRKDTTHMF